MARAVYPWSDKCSEEDKRAFEVFQKHQGEFRLDVGSLLERDAEARRFTEQYFSGTQYFAYVEEYCCMCTVTTLYKRG